ncbi:hypothetical protein KEJ50_01865 [Candidatus Bathyarchaeota archaeon]|nr:hypothetical protein [Candidatus Bathyarchaeota archaeon]
MKKIFIIVDEEAACYLKELKFKNLTIVKNRLEAKEAVKKVFQKTKLILATDKVYFWVKSALDDLMKIKKSYPLIVFTLTNKTLKEKAALIKNLALKLDKSAF